MSGRAAVGATPDMAMRSTGPRRERRVYVEREPRSIDGRSMGLGAADALALALAITPRSVAVGSSASAAELMQ